MNSKKFIVYASDLNSHTGEGTLAREFIKKIFSNNKFSSIKIITPNQNFFFNGNYKDVNNKNQKSIYHKYLIPIIGAFKLRYTDNNIKIVYVNYLPLWNCLLFLILPKRTLLGPITGSNEKYKVKNVNFFIRRFIFPVLFKISLIIINKKFKKIIFSTDLLQDFVKKNVDKKYTKNYLFNFVYDFFSDDLKKIFKKKYKKKNYILFYNKNHITKINEDLIFFLRKISKKYRIVIVGDKLNYKNFINLGYVNKKKIKSVQKKTKILISSNENLLSLFNIESINNGVHVIYNQSSFKKNFRLRSPFLKVNYKDFTLPLFDYLIKNNKQFKIDNNLLNKIKKQKNKINLFFNRFVL